MPWTASSQRRGSAVTGDELAENQILNAEERSSSVSTRERVSGRQPSADFFAVVTASINRGPSSCPYPVASGGHEMVRLACHRALRFSAGFHASVLSLDISERLDRRPSPPSVHVNVT